MISGAIFGLMQVDAELPPDPASMIDIIFSGGWAGLAILLVLLGLSVAAVYFVIDQTMTLRRAQIIPEGLAASIATLLAAGKFAEAERTLQQRPSLLAVVIASGLARREFGWAEIEKGAEEALLEQSARLIRRIDTLSMIANLAPMVGLLGTVTGMIFAFRQVAASRGAAGAGDLAEGIYQALVTTVGGLLIAIPALAASGILRNRVDELLSEATKAAELALAPLRRRMNAPQIVPPAQLPPRSN